VEKYDVVIIGTGQGGMPLSRALAQEGRKVAIIEREFVGGSCVNYGCTPSKALVHVAKVAHTVRRAGRSGIVANEPNVDMKKIRSLIDEIVKTSRKNSVESVTGVPNLQLIRGQATFVNASRLSIDGKYEIQAETVVINTGTRAKIPTIPGLDQVPFLDNRSILKLEELPNSLAILGAGYIGLEFGQIFSRLGCKVTILERHDTFLDREDDDVSSIIMRFLRAEGIQLALGAKVDRISKSELGVRIESDKGQFEAEALLVAVGRTPNTDALELDNAGVKCDKDGYVLVDEALKSSVENVFAIGDVKGGPAFTHISYDDYRILADNLLRGKQTSRKGRQVPYVMFTDPELGRIGLTEKEAKRKDIPYKVFSMPMSDVARAQEMQETEGIVKALVSPEGQIIGAAVLGAEGGEIMSMIQIAMLGKLTPTDLKQAILAHPTFAELLNNLFADA
jgi:pyruvate/2-oxoglutarate dehydrogenase complex dihydrolipoamide dehydrogenase (E3) component